MDLQPCFCSMVSWQGIVAFGGLNSPSNLGSMLRRFSAMLCKSDDTPWSHIKGLLHPPPLKQTHIAQPATFTIKFSALESIKGRTGQDAFWCSGRQKGLWVSKIA